MKVSIEPNDEETKTVLGEELKPDHGRYSWGTIAESRKKKQKEAKETYALRKEVTSILKREGYSEKEIANALGIHESSVRTLAKTDQKDETKELVMDVMGDYITDMSQQGVQPAEMRIAIGMSRTIIEAMKANEPPKDDTSNEDTIKFPKVFFKTREEAENVLSAMYDIVDECGTVTYADLMTLSGNQSVEADKNFGWTAFRDGTVIHTDDGWYLKINPAMKLSCANHVKRVFGDEPHRAPILHRLWMRGSTEEEQKFFNQMCNIYSVDTYAETTSEILSGMIENGANDAELGEMQRIFDKYSIAIPF